MQKFLLLAFRNVFRNRRRTLMTLVVVAGGVTALLLAGGFFSYMFYGLGENTIRNGVGHLQLYSSDYFQREETHVLENGLANYQELASRAAQSPHVKAVAPRIEFFGMVSNGMKSATFMATAVDPASEARLGFGPNIDQGRNFAPTASDNEALIGIGLARSMGVKPGSGLTLLAVTSDGALNGVDIDVVGIITTGVKELDDRVVRLTLPAAQRLLDNARVTKLVIGLDSTANTNAAQAALELRIRPLVVKNWVELSPFYRQVKLLFSGIFVFMGVIVFFMVLMSSANTLLMAIFERTREIGTMLAMGTPRSWITALFLLEGALTGVLGAAVGLVAGNAVAAVLNRAGLRMPPPPGSTNGFPFHVFHSPELMAAAAFMVVVTLSIAALMPAVRASRFNIVESLSHV